MNSTRYNTILLSAFLAVLVITLVRGYYYTYLQPNFAVLTYVSCDPGVDVCFEYEGEYYAYASIDAKEYATCSEQETCDEVCASSATCEIEYCSGDALSEGETCSAPGETGAEQDMEEQLSESSPTSDEKDLDSEVE